MSAHYQHVLIRQAFAYADRLVGEVHDIGLGAFAYADLTQGEVRVNTHETLEEAKENQAIHRFQLAALHVKKEAGFQDPPLYGIFMYSWEGAAVFATNNREQLQYAPVSVMEEYIDQHGDGKEAVSKLCAERAQNELAKTAKKSRPSDLASPEEALTRRNRSRCM